VQPRSLDETLYIMELANLQLAELEAYDRILDEAVEKAYRDLAARRFSRWTGAGVQRDLRELRMDLARLSDELSNITKFFGDWHLARIYQGLASRFIPRLEGSYSNVDGLPVAAVLLLIRQMGLSGILTRVP